MNILRGYSHKSCHSLGYTHSHIRSSYRGIRTTNKSLYKFTKKNDDSDGGGGGTEDDAMVKIGNSTRTIISGLKNFCNGSKAEESRLLPTNRIARCMKLTVQNGPSDVLLKLNGRQKYRLAHTVLRSIMPLCYSVCYDNLSCTVFPIGTPHQNITKSDNADVELKLKWVLKGCHRPPFYIYQPPDYKVSADSSDKAVLLEAYCFYKFDRRSGRLISHVIDWVAAVPPVDLQLELELAQPWIGKSGRVPGSTVASMDRVVSELKCPEKSE